MPFGPSPRNTMISVFSSWNDGSTDNTADMITPFLADQQERFQLLRLTTNAGKAEAVRRGMLLALEDHPDSVGFWDADRSTPLNQIPLVLRVLAQQPHVLLVMGSRVRIARTRNPTPSEASRIWVASPPP